MLSLLTPQDKKKKIQENTLKEYFKNWQGN